MTFDYVAREMLDPQGGFYSSQDADSEGIAGKFFVSTAEEIRAVRGHPEHSGASSSIAQSKDEAQKLLDVVFGEYRPNQVVAYARDGNDPEVPLLADRTAVDGHPTAYVCRKFVCQLPVTEPEALRAQANA